MSAHRGWLSSIRVKAVGVVFSLTAVLVAFLATYFPARHIASVRQQMRDKAKTYARLVSEQVEPGVAFDDRETVREVFTATSEDHDVRAMALYDGAGRPLFALGELSVGPVVAAVDQPNAVQIASGPSVVRATAPVISREGPRGTLVLEIDCSRAEAERHAIQQTSMLVGLGALSLGFLAAWAMATSISRRLGRIAGATRLVADGDLTVQPVVDSSSDEIGQLAHSFNRMFANIRALLDQIREANAREKERLDALVTARTRELDERNRDMRLVLDNVNQGLLMIERSGCVAKERSAVVERWFGPASTDAVFWEYIAPLDPQASASFRLNWEALLDDLMPIELSIDQLPRGLAAEDRQYELEYTPLFDHGAFARMLVVASDVTRRRAAERAESEQREVVCALGHIMRDRTGFLEFFDEAQSLIVRLCGERRPPLRDVKRWLHTLKGNVLIFGLTGFGSFCHSLEDALAESGSDLTESQSEALSARWSAFATCIRALLGDRDQREIAVNKDDYDGLMQGLLDGRPRTEIASTLAAWKLELASDRLARFGVQAHALAERLGRGPIAVSVDAGAVRFSREVMAPFWGAFGHAVRNAVDHGLESSTERAAAGKAPAGSVRLSATRSNSRVTIAIADDGRGVDWAKVAVKARAAGLPCETQGDLTAALFYDGLSTRDVVDGISGRGVGMGALRTECEKLGGRMSVASESGRGTTIQFVFDAAVVSETEETRRAGAVVRPGPGSMASEPYRPATGT